MLAVRCWFHTQIATWALVFRRRDVALDYYAKILAERPDDTLTRSRRAFLYAEVGDRAGAISEFEQVVQINNDAAEAWFNIGFLQQEGEHHEQAINAFEHAIASNERHDRAWYGKALSLIAMGRLTDAIAPLKKNTELQPMSPHGHMALARTYFRLGELDRCETRMRKLKGFDPQNAAALEDETGIKIGVERWWKQHS
jgi:tetratricopeptide (TPR) repeat protein